MCKDFVNLNVKKAALGIRDILVRIRILGVVALTHGSGCGFGRPKNIRIGIQNTGTFTSFSKIKSHQEVTKQ
jgi:hypothetical protein